MTKEEEIILTAESALRKLKHISNDANAQKKELSSTLVYYIAVNALAQIQQMKGKQK